MKIAKLLSLPLVGLLFAGCQTLKPIYTVEAVDLKRFMGNWYVIASIPTFIEKDAYNAVESYRLDEDGTVATTFRFNKGSLDGPLKEYTPRGFIEDEASNAVWGPSAAKAKSVNSHSTVRSAPSPTATVKYLGKSRAWAWGSKVLTLSQA